MSDPSCDACVKARTGAGWRPDLAERLYKETDNGCAVPKDFYTYAACEKRAWDLKYSRLVPDRSARRGALLHPHERSGASL
jgi:hypothetical protein